MGRNKAVYPTYNKQSALDEQNRLNTTAGAQTYANLNSPTGGYSVYVDPDTGKMTVNKNLSSNSLKAMVAQANALDKFVADPTLATKEYYDMQMAYIQPQFDAQVDAAKTDMLNRGIRPGSTAWNQALDNIDVAQERAKTEMINNAMFNGQNYQSGLLGQAQSAGNMVIDPQLIEGAKGTGLYDTYSKAFENEKARYKTQVANSNTWGQALNLGGSIIGGVIGGYFGGPMGAQMGAQGGGAAGSGWGGILDNN